MKTLHVIRNYLFYCGIEKDEYNAIKKDAYVSNFEVWRVLHLMIAAVLACLIIASPFSALVGRNLTYYLGFFLYFALISGFFFLFKKDSLVAQLLIYLSISVLFLLGAFLTVGKDSSATTFVVLLLITPMFMIDKPYFMAIELGAASAIYLIWMHSSKPHEVWQVDLVNIIIYGVVGIFLHIIANSIRIHEFVLTRKINLQKDLDDLTGLKNKGALTREINAFFEDAATTKGTLFVLDIDRFKAINDTYGHDVGDSVLRQIGVCLGSRFTADNEIVGRFGGDEFIVFLKGTDDLAVAAEIAAGIPAGVSESIALPDPGEKISISIGVAVYRGEEKNYSELFKKADIALYKAKADREKRFCIYE